MMAERHGQRGMRGWRAQGMPAPDEASVAQLLWLLLLITVVSAPHLRTLPFWISAIILVAAIWRMGAALKRWPMPGTILRGTLTIGSALAVGVVYRQISGLEAGSALLLIMLALKLVLRGADPVACYVFDEVDTGISGVTADVVGRQIRAVANERQVICVTHLPQIAAFADQHFHVAKSEKSGRTETTVTSLDKAARIDEVARMLSGAKLTKAAVQNAKQLIAEAHE